MTLNAQYLRGRTQFGSASSITSDNFVLGVHVRPSDRLSAFAEYRHGLDRLDWLTADRLTAEGADGIGLGASFDLTPFVSVGGGYDHQDRSGGGTVDRARALLTVRF